MTALTSTPECDRACLPIESPLSWTVCQIGAREHYSIPRALLKAGRNVQLLTDHWASGLSFTRRLRGRRHQDISSQCVRSFNLSGLALEVSSRVRRIEGWMRVEHRNRWFGEKASRELQASSPVDIVFSYSYAAREVFRTARSLGAMTVLGQIDPGPVEQSIVQQLHQRHSLPPLLCPSSEYWEHWREECDLADIILVNSEWSRLALASEGVPMIKVQVVPLAFEMSANTVRSRASVSDGFCSRRPLELLFLGQVIARKGIIELIEAATVLKAEPVRWHVVGPGDDRLLARLASQSNVIVHGPATRSDAERHYQRADVFVLPTHSDGYALTQLEAAAFGLPIIASRNCGEVVINGVNGILLDSVSCEQIVAAVRGLLDEPDKVTRMSEAQFKSEGRGISALAQKLIAVEQFHPLRRKQS